MSAPKLRVGSLFAGIGGFDLAAEWMGWETAWYSEIEPYASAVMKKRFPRAINLGDITQIDGQQAAPVDLLCGGFPCQDISLAGKGAGIDGERSGLWSHYRRLIEEIRPRWVVAENVSALRSRGLDRVLGELAALGYDAEWHCIPAAYVGAPHRRDRVWVIAWRTDANCKPILGGGRNLTSGRSNPESKHHSGTTLCDFVKLWPTPTATLGTKGGRVTARMLPTAKRQGLAGGERDEAQRTGATDRAERRSQLECGDWATEPDVGRVAHGVPSRVDRLRCLGNAVVPQVAALIFEAINEQERRMTSE